MLLDDAFSGRGTLLTDLADVVEVDLNSLDEALVDGWQRGLHCFVWLPYDLGEAHLRLRDTGVGAVFRFAERREIDAGSWLADTAPNEPAGVVSPAPAWNEDVFTDRVAAVHQAIRRGDTYQVNLTFPIRADRYGHPIDLYRRLRDRQPTEYAVLAHLPSPAPSWTLGLSPELFLQVDSDGTVRCTPMKGTARADEIDDPTTLAADPKNRAENVMIVDLLRNDLGQVAQPGSVAVTSLFDVSRVGDLWQMTSTVEALATPGTMPGALMRAAFPCGSITGAPKSSSMAVIRALEDTPRGGYTGSMGLLEPAEGPLGWKGSLNVAIRTVEIDDDALRLGVGAGITIGSDPTAEYRECLAKGSFLTGLAPQFSLIETILVDDGRAPRLAGHTSRLRASAAALGFPELDASALLTDALATVPSKGTHRARVEVAPDGRASIAHAPMVPSSGNPILITLAPQPWRPDALSRHKTTRRAALDQAWRDADAAGAFDALGTDADGYLLEGGRSSVFVLIDGVWRTPPLARGVLDGVARAEILEHGSLFGRPATEGDVTIDELRSADGLVVANALRGAMWARLVV